MITEYGIADLRGKTDRKVIEALLNITDSRFQTALIEQAQHIGKLPKDFCLDPRFANNSPERLHAIAARHPKWVERPVLIAVKQPGVDLTETDILTYYQGRVASWQIPDKVIFVDSLPVGGTGKVLKIHLRELYGDVLMDLP